ncbi:hypothetical protein BGZ89_009668 [Linnemannia elongata]|nr:hypothetical protein BGZ89_009668 [Linnemannia elongata]
MKNILNITLIATLAIAVSVAAQKAPAASAADTAAVAAQEAFQVPENQPVTPTSTSQDQDVNENEGDNDDQSAQWGKKHHHQKHHHKHHKHHHHKHGKHGQHGKHGKKDRCCIKYVTVTSVPECKPEPTKCPPKIEAAGTADGATAGGDAAPIAHEAAAIMEAWNPAPPAPAR